MCWSCRRSSARPAAFPALTFHGLGYQSEAVGQKAYNGVAVLSRLPFSVAHRALPGLPADDAQSRYIEVEAGGITIVGIYLPNGNSGGEAGFAYKLAWLDRLAERAEALLEADTPLVITGDFNVCPADEDWAPGALSADRRAGAPGEPRPVPPPVVGWPDRRGPRGAPAWRGLHVLGLPGGRLAARQRPADRPRAAVPDLAERLVAAAPDREERAQPQPSDHVPVVVELR